MLISSLGTLFAIVCGIQAGTETAAQRNLRTHKQHIVFIESESTESTSTGTGFLIENGWSVVTCSHVIAKSSAITVRASDGKLYRPISLKLDNERDIAIMRFPERLMPTGISFQKKDSNQGDHITIVGHPLGLTNTLSDGLISNFHESEQQRLIQFTAPISPGSSGSPILDDSGLCVGMVTSSITEGQQLNLGVTAADILNCFQKTPTISSEAFFSRASKGDAPKLHNSGKTSEAKEPLSPTDYAKSLTTATYDLIKSLHLVHFQELQSGALKAREKERTGKNIEQSIENLSSSIVYPTAFSSDTHKKNFTYSVARLKAAYENYAVSQNRYHLSRLSGESDTTIATEEKRFHLSAVSLLQRANDMIAAIHPIIVGTKFDDETVVDLSLLHFFHNHFGISLAKNEDLPNFIEFTSLIGHRFEPGDLLMSASIPNQGLVRSLKTKDDLSRFLMSFSAIKQSVKTPFNVTFTIQRNGTSMQVIVPVNP